MMLRSKLRWLIYQPRNGDGGSKSTRGCFAKRVAHLQRDTPSEPPGALTAGRRREAFFLSFIFVSFDASEPNRHPPFSAPAMATATPSGTL